jgi:hypothetical protein
MDMEVRPGAQRRSDCISITPALEVDWQDHWKEAVGRAMVLPQRERACRHRYSSARPSAAIV